MKDWKFKHLFIVTIGVLLISLVGVSSCLENEDNSFILPEFKEPPPPPIEVTVDQLYEEYMANEATANVKYIGKRLLFNEVEVEQLVGNFYQMYDALGEPASYEFVKLYFTAGFVKFRLRDFGIMQNIEEGYVLNLMGECQGLEKGFITIYDCWVESVVGDIVTGEEVDFY